LTKLGLPKPEELLMFLKQSVDEVFTTMLDTVAVLIESHGLESGSTDNPNTVDIEAVVEFSGVQHGAVVLRCTAEGAMDIARDMLMLPDSESIDLDEIKDALGECANMVSGSLKHKALDHLGEFSLGTPKIETYARHETDLRCGLLVYRLSNGHVAVEVWMDVSATSG
jgi:CheY-specific phosphatase CheX